VCAHITVCLTVVEIQHLDEVSAFTWLSYQIHTKFYMNFLPYLEPERLCQHLKMIEKLTALCQSSFCDYL